MSRGTVAKYLAVNTVIKIIIISNFRFDCVISKIKIICARKLNFLLKYLEKYKYHF